MNRLILLFISFLFLLQTQAQQAPTVKFITEKIKLDGVLDEQAWQTAEKMPSFW
jgi:hypothetical protein